MLVEKCAFDPVRDISPVDQFGFIDLKSALAHSVVPSVMPEAEGDYNGVDDPGAIIGTPEDIFEAMEMQRAAQAAAADANAGNVEDKSE